MKTKILTQKSFIGMLMALVLALGVQGIADAITRPTAQTEAHANTVDSTVRDVGGSIQIAATNIVPDRANLRETVKITKSSGITLTGSYYGLSSVTLTEVDDDLTNTNNGSDFTYTLDGRDQTIGGTTTGSIDITFTAKGQQWVKISSTDYDDPNDPNDFSGSWSTTYTYYVKGPGTSTTTISLLGLRNGYKTGIFAGTAHRERIHTGDSGHYAVTYTTVPSGAQAQIETTAGALGALTALNSVNTSSAFDVLLQANATYQVTANVTDSDRDRETVGVYIIGTPTLTVGYPDNPDGIGGTPTAEDGTGHKNGPGLIHGTLTNAFKVRITDGTIATIPAIADSPQADGAVPGVVVTFQVSGSGDAGGYLEFNAANDGFLVDRNNRRKLNSDGSFKQSDTAKTLYVRTEESGRAVVNFQLGTDRKQDVTISAVGQSKVVSAYTGTAASGNQLVNPESKSSQAAGRTGEYELRVKAEDEDGNALSQHHVEFRTSDGTLDDPSDATAATDGGRLPVRTDTRGIAFVFFDPTDSADSLRVTAHLLDTATTATAPVIGDNIIDDVVFNIRGGSSAPQPQPQPVQQRNRLTISTTGEGATRSVTVNALTTANAPIPGLSVVLSGTALTTPQTVTTGTPVAITLRSTSGDYTLIATDPNGTFDTGTLTVTVSAPGTLTLTLGARNGNQQTITARAVRGGSVQSGVNLTIRGGATSHSRQTGADGSVSTVITLPTATSAHTLTVSAAGYDSAQATAAAPGQREDPPPSRATGVADSIEIDGSRIIGGTVNQATRLRVRVLDGNDNGVSGVKVTFKVLRPGNGMLSQRGNGRAVAVETDSSGSASATLTPLGGDLIVEAKAAQVSAPVSFIINVSGAADDPEPPAPGTDDTPRTDIDPTAAEVHVGAANRPPMLWVDGGKIYALVGKDVQEFGSGVEGAMNVAVAGGKVYWTEQTDESSGTINSANLNGTGVKELTSILAVPMGIAVDTAGSKLYWTNSRGRIQSANLDGSKITNVLQDLPSLMDIALAGGNAYWTQGGNVRFVNLSGTKRIRNISTGTDTAGSLVIGGNKVYWTEMTGTSSGTINSANLNGTGATQLASILAVPSGIAVDGSRSKLFWTNSRGRVQSANLDGSKITNVVSGLGMPGDIVLSNSISAPAAETPTKPPTPTAKSKYDVNGDGTVDNTDASLVAAAMNTTNAKYDVTGDGVVNFLDLLEVFDNRNDGAAGAPTIVGMKLSAAQVDILQEQIDLLIATGDRSPAAMRTLIYLQQLIATARPEKTQLLANYPNPFNPETWIPYELATATNVRITIYNTQGVVIRTLALGHQSAGYYTGRDRAAYWDGRNALGEQVASGIYFYQFETDAMSSMRKMVILK